MLPNLSCLLLHETFLSPWLTALELDTRFIPYTGSICGIKYTQERDLQSADLQYSIRNKAISVLS
jgi:hypothetical protein